MDTYPVSATTAEKALYVAIAHTNAFSYPFHRSVWDRRQSPWSQLKKTLRLVSSGVQDIVNTEMKSLTVELKHPDYEDNQFSALQHALQHKWKHIEELHIKVKNRHSWCQNSTYKSTSEYPSFPRYCKLVKDLLSTVDTWKELEKLTFAGLDFEFMTGLECDTDEDVAREMESTAGLYSAIVSTCSFPKLETLRLNGCGFDEFTTKKLVSTPWFEQLKSLDLFQPSSLPDVLLFGIGGCSQLTSISLIISADIYTDGPDCYETVSNKHVKGFSNLTKLRELYFRENSYGAMTKEAMKELFKLSLPELESLSVDADDENGTFVERSIEVEGLATVDWPNLTSLDFRDFRWSVADIEKLRGARWRTNLSDLTLAAELASSSAALSDEHVQALVSLKLDNITYLDLSNSNFTSKGVGILVSSFPKLRHFSLESLYSKFDDNCCEQLANNTWAELTCLDLNGRQICSKGAKNLAQGNFKSLESLYVGNDDEAYDEEEYDEDTATGAVEWNFAFFGYGRFPKIQSIGQINVTGNKQDEAPNSMYVDWVNVERFLRGEVAKGILKSSWEEWKDSQEGDDEFSEYDV